MDKTVLYLGNPGSNSHRAAGEISSPRYRLQGVPGFDEIFTSVSSSENVFGVIPLENSLTGSISRSFDLLLDKKVSVTGEVYLKINHCLAVKGKKRPISRLKICFSHPEVFKQCSKFMKSHKSLVPTPETDTASACRRLNSAGAQSCAIAGRLAARINGLTVIKEHLEDYRSNFTRFIVISKKSLKQGGKISLLFTLAHRPGSLAEALRPLAKAGFNLTKIESRPITGKPWEYLFFMDLENLSGTPFSRCLTQIGKHTRRLKVLGIYEKGKTIND